MSPAGADAVRAEETIWTSPLADKYEANTTRLALSDQVAGRASYNEDAVRHRRTPRRSLIVVLPENHVVSADNVSEHLEGPEADQIDVILACAGQPNGISALQRKVRGLQVLLAPAGTSDEDLRELAMARVPGDIVTLLNGTSLGG